MNKSILRLPAVQGRTGLARSTIYAYVAQQLFPKPIRIGARSVGWLSTDIDSWIEERSSEQRKEA